MKSFVELLHIVEELLHWRSELSEDVLDGRKALHIFHNISDSAHSTTSWNRKSEVVFNGRIVAVTICSSKGHLEIAAGVT